MSKVYEKCMFKQMFKFFEDVFLKNNVALEEVTALNIEKRRTTVDQGKVFSALLSDLSNTLDFLDHDLIIVKLNAYGISLSALRLIHDYLSNREQRTRINNSYSNWLEIIFGAQQGPIYVVFLPAVVKK